MSFDALFVPFSSIEKGTSIFEFITERPDLRIGQGCRFSDVIRVEVRVTTVGEDYLVEQRVESMGICECDRCGESFQRDFLGSVKSLYSFDATNIGDDDSDGVQLLSSSSQGIDLSQDVLDALVLAVPSKNLCREDCAGLCSRCGQNLNKGQCA